MIRKLFSTNPARVGRFEGPPTCDVVPASLVGGPPDDLKADLIALSGKEEVLHRAIDLVRYASDASPYRLVPQVVVLPRTIDDVVKLSRYCRETGRHATFRAAGTSLNGQSQSDDILIDVRRHWYGGKVEDDGRRVRGRPGMILGHINSLLERHGRGLGPDPASSHACTIGGVIANDAGGMRCTAQNDAYHTVSSLTFVTPSGAVIDTSRPDEEKEYALAEPQLEEGLLELQRELLADPVLADRTRRKYAIRNTHGLRLCALLNGETPLAIFRRRLVGSEGTLAFIAEAVLETIPAPRVTSVAWVPVSTIDEAIALVPGLVSLGASAVELMVAPALTAADQAFAETPSYWRTLDPKAAALLVEIGAEDSDSLEVTQHQVLELVSAARLVKPVECTSLAEAIELAWHVREGLLGLAGKNRPEGSTLITEDGDVTLALAQPKRSKSCVMKRPASYKRHHFPAQIISQAVWLYFRFPLSLRLVEEMLLKRGIVVSYETIRRWGKKFGPAYARRLRRKQPSPNDIWHLDEVVINIAGKKHWLWRAVDQDGYVLDEIVQSRRDTKAAKRLRTRLLKVQGGAPRRMITDKLRSYGAVITNLTQCNLRMTGERIEQPC